MENENVKRRGVPVKMIWLFITIGTMFSCVGSAIGAAGSVSDRMLENILWGSVPVALLALGTGLCLSRGCINLSMPGTMAVSSLAFAASLDGGLPTAAAVGLALLAGAAFGALNGLFAIQKSRSVKLVTAFSSLFVGAMGLGIAYMGGNRTGVIRIDTTREMITGLAVMLLLLAFGVCFVSAIGGRKLFRTFEGDSAATGGGDRFLWTAAAGVLAALAGIFQVYRIRTFNASSNDMYYQCAVFFTLIAAGILIPNVRESYGEALCGLLAIPFGAMCHSALSYAVNVSSGGTGGLYVICALLGLLLMIPNMLIYKRRKDP